MSWEARHRFIAWTAVAHAPALALFGWLRGWSLGAWLGESALVALVAALAFIPGLSRRLRSGLAGLALVTASAVLVQFSGGFIEAHFHYFIVVALVSLYEDYVPFLLAIGYVAFDHGVVGSIAPEWVYNHASGSSAPWQWAIIHAVAILGESVALLGFWAGSQQLRQQAEQQQVGHRRELEQLVERRTAQLTAANRELEAFSYTVSHDLRSPLRAIDGFATLLERRHGQDVPPEAAALLEQIHHGVGRMDETINSVLTLTRISRVDPSFADVDLSALGKAILSELQAEAPERKVDWDVEPGLHAVGDEGLLRLALHNLLSNAWKFTSRTEQARIRVRRDPASGGIVVEDNGAGFDMAHASELFQPFKRLHAPGQFPGTGIGLATVERIARRHGGRAWAESAPGEGARFFLTLAPPTVTVPAKPRRSRKLAPLAVVARKA